MHAIRDAIADGERGHAGELCLAIESRYSPWAVMAGLQARDRARQVFSLLRVWDTQGNSGVLMYLQLAERRVELVADRGIAARVDPALWQALCADFATCAPVRPTRPCCVAWPGSTRCSSNIFRRPATTRVNCRTNRWSCKR